MTTRIRGLDVLQRRLRDLIDGLRPGGEEARQAAAEAIATRARALVEVRSGATRATIRAEGGKVVAGGAALYLERGTSKMPAEPFLVPAVAQSQSQATDAAAGKLRQVIDRAL